MHSVADIHLSSTSAPWSFSSELLSSQLFPASLHFRDVSYFPLPSYILFLSQALHFLAMLLLLVKQMISSQRIVLFFRTVLWIIASISSTEFLCMFVSHTNWTFHRESLIFLLPPCDLEAPQLDIYGCFRVQSSKHMKGHLTAKFYWKCNSQMSMVRCQNFSFSYFFCWLTSLCNMPVSSFF